MPPKLPKWLRDWPGGTYDYDTVLSYFDEPYHEYFESLGRFIHAYAEAEAELFLLLKHVSGLTNTKAGVLFSGIRAEGARDTINNLLDATNNIALKNRLNSPFSQMATIGTVRNNIVHWGAVADNTGGFIVSNKLVCPLKSDPP
jgi:hypothetical protein